MWVEMSEGMCDHANNYYMLKKKGNQKEKYYHKLKTNIKKKKCVCVWKNSLRLLATKKTGNVYSYMGLCI